MTTPSPPSPSETDPVEVLIVFKTPQDRRIEIWMSPEERELLVTDFCNSNVFTGSYRYADTLRIALRFEDVLYIA